MSGVQKSISEKSISKSTNISRHPQCTIVPDRRKWKSKFCDNPFLIARNLDLSHPLPFTPAIISHTREKLQSLCATYLHVLHMYLPHITPAYFSSDVLYVFWRVSTISHCYIRRASLRFNWSDKSVSLFPRQETNEAYTLIIVLKRLKR